MVKNVIKIVGISLGILVLCIIVTSLFLLRHGFKQVELSPYALPKQISQSWDDVFNKPAPVSVVAFNTGQMKMDRYPDNPQNAEDRYKPADIPAFWVHPRACCPYWRP